MYVEKKFPNIKYAVFPSPAFISNEIFHPIFFCIRVQRAVVFFVFLAPASRID